MTPYTTWLDDLEGNNCVILNLTSSLKVGEFAQILLGHCYASNTYTSVYVLSGDIKVKLHASTIHTPAVKNICAVEYYNLYLKNAPLIFMNY